MKFLLSIFICFSVLQAGAKDPGCKCTTVLMDRSHPENHVNWVVNTPTQVGHFEICQNGSCQKAGSLLTVEELPSLVLYFWHQFNQVTYGSQYLSDLMPYHRGVPLLVAAPLLFLPTRFYFLLLRAHLLSKHHLMLGVKAMASLGLAAAISGGTEYYLHHHYKKIACQVLPTLDRLKDSTEVQEPVQMETPAYQFLVQSLNQVTYNFRNPGASEVNFRNAVINRAWAEKAMPENEQFVCP